jgi:4-alpha-glucanotransferase
LQISVESLCREPWFNPDLFRFEPAGRKESGLIDYAKMEQYDCLFYQQMLGMLNDSYDQETKNEFSVFCNEQAFWLNDYALFMALSDEFETNDWKLWPEGLLHRQTGDLALATKRHTARIDTEKFRQFLFFRQWKSVLDYAHSRNVQIIGDIPIYVNFESADVWANQEIFMIDRETEPRNALPAYRLIIFLKPVNAGATPCTAGSMTMVCLISVLLTGGCETYFAFTAMVDVIRIDHFRAFESFWAIPSEEETAVKGTWLPGPGAAFFNAIREKLGELPLIAEDLGIITPEVEKLRDDFELPGMKILQFAFDGNSGNSYLPHNIENVNCVIYTGTHDNNTTNGWYYGGELDADQKRNVCDYLGLEHDHDMHLKIIRTALMSTARLAIIPVQDIPGYGCEYRTNTPGLVVNNWRWRLGNGVPEEPLRKHMRHLLALYGRLCRK